MKRTKLSLMGYVLFVLLCLAINWGGDRIVSRLNWPVWMDTIGTVLCSYIAGPFCGAVVGITSNLLGHILYGTPWMYAIVSLIIAAVIGFARRKRRLDNLLGTLTVGVILALSTSIAAYFLNLTFNNGSTGSNWGDAVKGFAMERGMSSWLSLFIGILYLELADKLLILLLLYLAASLIMTVWRKFHPESGKEETADPSGVERMAALLLALGLGFSAMPAETGRAEEAGETRQINYNDYVQTVYSSLNGLPCGEANDIAITGDGIMWIGTYAGLYRYNGREFRWMDSFDSVRNVNCLYVDEEGRLWIGSNDNGLSIMINEQVVNVIDQNHGLPANSVKSIIKSSDGYYYIGTTGSMQILTLNNGLKKLNSLSEVTYADASAADSNGNVAVINNNGVLFLMRQGHVVSSRQLPESQAVFKSCTFDPDGYLLAGTTENEIYKFDVSRGWIEPLKVFKCPELRSITNLQYIESGELFVCADNGIGLIVGGEFEKINTNDFNNSIDNMMMDYQGNLWFTSSRLGLLRLAPSDFRDLYSTAGMDNRVTNTVVRWQDTYYIGTDKGLDALDLRGKKQVVNELTERYTGVRIRCMLVDSRDHLWICTYGGGLVEIDPDGTEHLYNRDNGAFGNRARVVTELRDGTILAAGDTGLTFIRDHQIEHTIEYAEGHISSMVLSITEMQDGRILAGTDGNGIAIIEDWKVTRMLTRKDGLSSEVILRTILDTKTGGVFVVTSNGLCYMNTDDTVRQLDNFPYFNNYDIWIKGTDSLFVLSSAGIYTVDRNELLSGRDNIKYDLLDSRRGLNSSLTANAWTWYDEESGELYLPCDTGVFVTNTNSFNSGTTVYRMSVPSVRLDGAVCRVDRNITLEIPRGISKVELFPEVINYTIQEPYVGYLMEGFDNDWTIVPQNQLNSIAYTNLPTGSYTFHLAVFDNNRENILAERTYSMVKEKEMYDNNWFIFYILLVPVFVVAWVAWLLIERHENKMRAELAQANKLIEMGKQTVIAIARTVDAKDQRTADHSRRVAIYSSQIAREYGMDEKQCQDIEWAAQMHDIGKIGIPDSILNKPSRLTDEEYATMKSHTTRGAEILKDFTLLDNVIEGAEFHHERYDGRGYPKGLSGEDIPLYARIIGVADAFDAMTANRIYRKQMDFSYVLGEMEKGRGTQFDPKFVDILLKLIRDGKINLNRIYHVSREESEQAEAKASENAAGVKADGNQGEKSSDSSGRIFDRKTPEGGKA